MTLGLTSNAVFGVNVKLKFALLTHLLLRWRQHRLISGLFLLLIIVFAIDTVANVWIDLSKTDLAMILSLIRRWFACSGLAMPAHASSTISHVAITVLSLFSLSYFESINLVEYFEILMLTHFTVALKAVLPVIYCVDKSAEFASPLAFIKRNLNLRLYFLLLWLLFLRRLFYFWLYLFSLSWNSAFCTFLTV